MTGSHPPAWYEDPRDPTRVRRWNGRGWTTDVRPRPPWLRTVRLAPGPAPDPPSIVRRLWLASIIVCVLALALFGMLNRSTADDADRLVHSGYAVAADHECFTTQHDVRALDPKLKGARRAEARLQLVEPMVERLGNIRPGAEDRTRVYRWIHHWDVLVAQVNDQLDANGVGDSKQSEAAFKASQDTKALVDHFAAVNGMFDCVL